jgi:hypothetical protein
MLPRASGSVLVLIIGGEVGGGALLDCSFSCERRNPGLHSATLLTLGSCVRRRTEFYRKGAARDNATPLPDQPAVFIDAMSMTKRYFTSLFTMR